MMANKRQQEKTLANGVFVFENTLGNGFFLLPLDGRTVLVVAAAAVVVVAVFCCARGCRAARPGPVVVAASRLPCGATRAFRFCCNKCVAWPFIYIHSLFGNNHIRTGRASWQLLLNEAAMSNVFSFYEPPHALQSCLLHAMQTPSPSCRSPSAGKNDTSKNPTPTLHLRPTCS
jgi:hypothetical protein